MARKIKWTLSAWTDLEGIADYIAKDSPHYAASFIHEVKDAAQSLSQLALRGRTVPEFSDANIRELFLWNYRLIYQVTEQSIYILGVIHGARDLWKLLDLEGRNMPDKL